MIAGIGADIDDMRAGSDHLAQFLQFHRLEEQAARLLALDAGVPAVYGR